jgi:hypothetical protein
MQTIGSRHALPQAPQLFGSERRSTQAPPQFVLLGVHCELGQHAPSTHVSSAAHLL